jgi:hypothetical protein
MNFFASNTAALPAFKNHLYQYVNDKKYTFTGIALRFILVYFYNSAA